jgi:hypothetical protein
VLIEASRATLERQAGSIAKFLHQFISECRTKLNRRHPS